MSSRCLAAHFLSVAGQKGEPHILLPSPFGEGLGVRPLCSLYAGGVLWTRNRELKTSVTSVFSVREKSSQRVTRVSSHSEGAFFFSQIYTDEQNSQRCTETLSQPISQSVTANISYNVL